MHPKGEILSKKFCQKKTSNATKRTQLETNDEALVEGGCPQPPRG